MLQLELSSILTVTHDCSLCRQSLNNFLYWASQIVGSILTGFFLDWKIKRRMRAWGGLIWLTVLVVRPGLPFTARRFG